MTTNNTTNWNILYGIHHGNHMVDCLTDTVFFSDLLPNRCPTLYKNITRILTDNDIDYRCATSYRQVS